ncbi:MAG: radical SAM family heme chaperone HemW [Dongiaceae bacterium]
MTGEGGFALYVHWPFCLAKCPYCDFNSHVRDAIDQPRWRAALLAELDHYAAETPGRRLDSIFFGGGTPSLMDPETVAAVIARATRHWPAAAGLEATLEANPTSVEAGRFAAYGAAGVNRVSLGVQALDDRALARLGRRHSAAEARAAIAVAQRHFARSSFDLIYARPGQDLAGWLAELDEALDLAAEHLSLYQLTIEPGTVFEGAARRGELVLPGEDDAALLYEATQERLERAGLPAYEISNHARPGAACRHNLVYWRYGDYVGIGPGAHGRLTLGGARLATRQHRAPEAWLAAVERAGHATRQREPVPEDAQVAEWLMMGLRLAEGVGEARSMRLFGRGLDALVPAARRAPLVEAGYLESDATGLRATPAGRQRLDAVLRALLA